jgi:hypothetical protein
VSFTGLAVRERAGVRVREQGRKALGTLTLTLSQRERGEEEAFTPEPETAKVE